MLLKIDQGHFDGNVVLLINVQAQALKLNTGFCGPCLLQ